MFVKTPKIIQWLFPSLVWVKSKDKKQLWLTFDDGPHPEVTPYLLDVLAQHNIHATFFLEGQYIQLHPELHQLILAKGHTVGNHTFSHKNGWSSSTKNYLDDVAQCQKLMPQNTLFRPPYGKISRKQMEKLKRKYKLILWDVLSWDFKGNQNPNTIKTNVLNNVNNGSIIVFHNNLKSFPNLKKVLNEILEELKRKGFTFSTTW